MASRLDQLLAEIVKNIWGCCLSVLWIEDFPKGYECLLSRTEETEEGNGKNLNIVSIALIPPRRPLPKPCYGYLTRSNQTCSPEQEKHRREEPPQVEGTKKWGWSMAGEIGKANKFHTNAWMILNIKESRVIRPAYLCPLGSNPGQHSELFSVNLSPSDFLHGPRY